MEDIIRRRKLLREKLEGKVEENSKSIPEVKSSRLNIPSIFQKGSQENLSTQTKLAVPKSLSKSTGNIHEESLLKFSLVKEKTPPVKPPRKSKSKDNLTNSNQSLDSLNNDHFLSSTEDLQEPKIEPVVVELRKKSHILEDTQQTTSSEVFLRRKLSSLSIKRNSSDCSSTVFNFVDQSPSPKSSSVKSPIVKKLEHNPSLKRSGSRVGFIELINKEEQNDEDIYDNANLKNIKVEDGENKSSSPKSPIEKKFEHNPSLKRSGSRGGFMELIYKEEQNDEGIYNNANLKNIKLEDKEDKSKKEEEYANEELYDNVQLKNIPVPVNTETTELYENLEILRANKYYSKKITTGPVSKLPVPTKRCGKPEPRERSIITL